jgi:hypothetical protein
MSDNPGTSPFDQFVIDLTRSCLVDPDYLAKRLEAFRAQRPVGEDDAAMLVALAYGLIADGTLTAWQCQNLRAGRWKGFFQGEYLVLGHLGHDESDSYYLMRHRQSGQPAAVRVMPATRSKTPGTTECEVVWRLPWKPGQASAPAREFFVVPIEQ